MRTIFLTMAIAFLLGSPIQAQVGIGTTTPAASAQLDVSSITKGLLPPRMTETQRNAIAAVEGLMIYNTTTKKPNFYNGTEWMHFDGTSAATIEIGALFKGGKKAYIFQPGDPGYVEGEIHGIIAAPTDQAFYSNPPWGCNGVFRNTIATALGQGKNNTTHILGGCPERPIAASICNNLNLNGYTDWFLPSKDELNKLYINRVAVGGFATSDFYWSSSEFDANTVWVQRMGGGSALLSQFKQSKLGGDAPENFARVRAVRYF